MKTVTIDGLEISPELVEELKTWCPGSEGDDLNVANVALIYISKIQDYLCRKLGQIDNEEVKEVAELLDWLVSIKDRFSQLKKILPVTPYKNGK